MNDAELNAIFKSASEKINGNKPAMGARFARFHEPKFEIRTNGEDVYAAVSDYYTSAPSEVVRNIADWLTKYAMWNRNTMARTEVFHYSWAGREVRDWTDSSEFIKTNKEKMLKRWGAKKNPAGKHKDLRASYARLVKANLVPEIEDLALGWIRDAPLNSAGIVYTEVKCVNLDDRYDDEKIGDAAVDYALYKGIAMVMIHHGLMGCEKGNERELAQMTKRFAYRFGTEAEAYAVEIYDRITNNLQLLEEPAAGNAMEAARWKRRPSRTAAGGTTSSTRRAV